MAALEVVRAGMLTLLQDSGRLGVAQLGLSQGGALDMHAYCWANYLLGNDMSCSQLEMTLGQASFKSDHDIVCAITGADAAATIDGIPVKPWQTFCLSKGSLLAFNYPRKGLRTYLAVKGGFQCKPMMDSVSTVVRNKVGGIDGGRALLVGDMLPMILPSLKSESHVRYAHKALYVAPRFIPDYEAPLTLRVIESYQHTLFSEHVKARFYSNSYRVSPQCDRMGCRLDGPNLNTAVNGIISEGIAYGAIQIPPNGLPIILFNDRQTLGGYPKLGCVARIDMAKLAQAAPGKEVQFLRGNIEELQQEWIQFSRYFGLPY
ncbi:biotin-dependent carboxyltransferase family protein [Photobacterium indicum]|uniref:5-oxoprolinase subunit C family protein n=1 Tax=Photobacterium indicum TaxID=81447 RepID=UPI003D0E932F